TPNTNNQFIKYFCGFLAIRREVGDLHLAALAPALDGGAGDAAAEADVEPLLLQDLLGLLGDLLIHDGQEILHGLQQHHLRTEALPYAAKLEADHPGAD